MTEAQWAWLAGFFDGEGCVHAIMRPRPRQISLERHLTISQKDRASLDQITQWLGFGSVRQTTNGRTTWHIFQVKRRDEVRQVVEGILPYAIVKREQLLRLKELLDRPAPRMGHGCKLPDEELQTRYRLCAEIQSLKVA